MTDRVLAPLIIGITGKRDLGGKDEAVRAALRTAFECLDRSFGNTPKILLSALAQGVDILAAEEALEHAERQRKVDAPSCPWRVEAILPLPLNLYRQDFDKENIARLTTLCEKVHSQVLPPLRRGQPGGPFELGAPFAWEELNRSAHGNPHRTAHYEQVGLHIADQCGLLVAVLDRDEPPTKIGGAARVLDYRVRGELDSSSRDTVRRSQVLARLPLDRPQPAPAWVIDLASVGATTVARTDAMELWEPVESVSSNGLPDMARRMIAWLTHNPRWKKDPINKVPLANWRQQLRRLWLAEEIERFNAQVSKISAAQWHQEVEERAGLDNGDAASKLRRIRLALALLQRRKKRQVSRTIFWLAMLFVLAIVALETHIEFHLRPAFPLFIYIALFLAILVIFYVARLLRLQEYMENYRAVAEAVRVQLAWWDAKLLGLEHRVDRTYLAGTAGSLARLRTAVRHLIDSTLLQWGASKSDPSGVQRWIDDQITFFTKRTKERHRSLFIVERTSWFLFSASFILATALAIVVTTTPIDEIYEKMTLITMIGAAGLAGAIRYYAERLSQEHELFTYRDALVSFMRAREDLAELDADDSTGGQQRREDIITTLGIQALGENEAWIRAHRVRPLEPLV